MGQLGTAVRGELKPTRTAIRRLDEEPREVLGSLQSVQITDLREKLATYLEEVFRGRALTVVSSGRFAATLVIPREFDRLWRLHRIVSWFAAAGLDLGAADEAKAKRIAAAFAAAGGAAAAADAVERRLIASGVAGPRTPLNVRRSSTRPCIRGSPGSGISSTGSTSIAANSKPSPSGTRPPRTVSTARTH